MTAKLKSNARTLLQGSENSAGNWLHFLKNANHYLASSTPMMTKFAVLKILLDILKWKQIVQSCIVYTGRTQLQCSGLSRILA